MMTRIHTHKQRKVAIFIQNGNFVAHLNLCARGQIDADEILIGGTILEIVVGHTERDKRNTGTENIAR